MPTSDRSDIYNAVSQYFEDTFSKHGATPQGLDWGDGNTQQIAHVQFLRLFRRPDASVLDYGCGYGDFLSVLRKVGHRGRYVGYDLVPGLIEAAKKLHGEGPDRAWHVGGEPQEVCDYAIASGILNIRRGVDDAGWIAYVQQMIHLLAAHGRLGFGFNMLSTICPRKRRDDLYVANPMEVLEWCMKTFSTSVSLLHDYGLCQFTVLVQTADEHSRPKAAGS